MATLTQNLYHYSHTVGFYAQNGRGFNNPVDVALGRDGVLYVLNRAGSDVELFPNRARNDDLILRRDGDLLHAWPPMQMYSYNGTPIDRIPASLQVVRRRTLSDEAHLLGLSTGEGEGPARGKRLLRRQGERIREKRSDCHDPQTKSGRTNIVRGNLSSGRACWWPKDPVPVPAKVRRIWRIESALRQAERLSDVPDE
jgi:hypothetical protein